MAVFVMAMSKSIETGWMGVESIEMMDEQMDGRGLLEVDLTFRI